LTARVRVLLVSGNSVARALLSALLDPARFEPILADSLPTALRVVAAAAPHVAIVQAEIVRSSPDAIERLRAACGTNLPIVLADRAYVDERRATSEVVTFGAGAFVPVPPDGPTLEDAISAAARGKPRKASVPSQAAMEIPEIKVVDSEQAARYAERLAAKIESMDAYQVLRVARGAAQADVENAFRQRALEYHPDRQHHVHDAATREHLYRIFKRVSWAFRQIGDRAARRQYDATTQDPRKP
jgi:DNA-binding response OmpR family regulator